MIYKMSLKTITSVNTDSKTDRMEELNNQEICVTQIESTTPFEIGSIGNILVTIKYNSMDQILLINISNFINCDMWIEK